MKTLKAKHYAKALVDLGDESSCLTELVKDLRGVDEKINANLDFKKYLINRHIEFGKKKKALNVVFQDFIGQKTYNFIYLLIKDGKLDYLSSILAVASKISLQKKDLSEVLVESVIPLTPDQEKKIEKKAKAMVGGKLILKNIINKDIIAGVRIFIGDMEIDGSLRGKILRLKNKIEELG